MDKALLVGTEVLADLKDNILPFWTSHICDPAGGFFGAVRNDGVPVVTEDKGSVLNARILWTFSCAYRHFGLESHKAIADRAASYFLSHFIDNRHGGVYWSLRPDGTVSNNIKQSYATAFGIYGTAEHYRATGDMNSLEAAKKLFRTLQDKVHDSKWKGYYEVFGDDYNLTDTDGVDGVSGAVKTMNSHIHIMEAYTTLYRIWPDSEVRDALVELVNILQNRLYSKRTGHLILYCDEKWKPLKDIDSFAHDIETSWLLTETADALGIDSMTATIRKQSLQMVDAALSGQRADGVMRDWHDTSGYAGKLSWWAQCETIIGCVNAWQLSGEEKYLDTALKVWSYVKGHFIDHRHGDWLKNLNADGTPLAGDMKVSEWNCPYHSCRMGFEMLNRLPALSL